MSKSDGQKIAIKFDKPLVNVATTPPEGYPELKASEGTPTASNQYSSSYSADKVFDGSTSSYWQTRAILPQWIQIQLLSPIALTRFRWYTSSYAPNQFELYGSQNGIDFVLLYSGESPSSSGWKSFDIPNSKTYSYYRWNILSGHSSGRIYIYEIEMFYKEFQDEGAFTITGMVRNPLKVGELQPKVFSVASVERYTIDEEEQPDTILLSFDTYNRFNDVEGDITVAYNQSLGTLAGARPVESFSVDFTPTDLEPTPIDEHTITAGIDLTVDLIDLEFTEIYADHNVTHTATAGIDVTVALINIEDINP